MYIDTELTAYKRKIHRQVAIVLSLMLLLIVNIGGLFAGAVFYNELCVLNSHNSILHIRYLSDELQRGIRTRNWQDVSIESHFGYTLNGTYLPNPVPSDKTVIFVHGITANRLMGLRFADLYLNEGFNLLIYDSRAHGESGGTSVTWGYYEKFDLDQWIDWLDQQHPKGIVGVHGVSMGAATALVHAELNESSKRVKFYIADSAYSDLETLLTKQFGTLVHSQSPLWIKVLLKYSSIVAYFQSRFRYDEVSPVRAVRSVTTPVLYLHDEGDTLVPFEMCRELYQATRGYREIHTFSSAGHARGILERKAEYKLSVHSFIQTALGQYPGQPDEGLSLFQLNRPH